MEKLLDKSKSLYFVVLLITLFIIETRESSSYLSNKTYKQIVLFKSTTTFLRGAIFEIIYVIIISNKLILIEEENINELGKISVQRESI